MSLMHEPRWCVDIPIRTAGGGRGVHTFIIGAATQGEAVETAWRNANSRDAIRHRSGAVLMAARHLLIARPYLHGLV